jgi:hypothetical protein
LFQRGSRLVALLFALIVATSAFAAAGVAATAPRKADKHDRTLINRLLKSQIRPDERPDDELLAIAEACPAWQQADAARRPVLAAGLVIPEAFRAFDRLEPALVRYQRVIAPLRPHARSFKDWLAIERRGAAHAVMFARQFDSSRMDVCAYLEAFPATADDEEALIAAILKLLAHPDDIAALVTYGEAEEADEAKRAAANKRFATFLRASGYSRAQITALTG